MIGVLQRFLQIFSVIQFFFILLCGASWGQSDPISWVDNNDMLLFYEAIVKVQENALMTESGREMIQKAVAGYIEQLDPFSHYLTSKDFAVYKQAQNNEYAGVAMDIFKDRSGRLICLPYPGGPAHESGLAYGDILTFVDGTFVENFSVFAVGRMIRGIPNSSVSLMVQTPSGIPTKHSLIRRKVAFESVQLTMTGDIPVIRIIRFTKHTATELKKTLERLKPSGTRIIDLRGNTGGDFFSAIDAVSLLLKPGLKIIDVKTRAGIKSYLTTSTPLDITSRLFLWQDSLTASAAEVFIVALVENDRAVSLGQTTFGKGVSQKVIELSDGSALIITNSALRSPSGLYFHEQGLPPDHRVEKSSYSSQDRDYWSKTKEILHLTPKHK